ncbi:hypothetical protein BX600DRAFT_497900 [Xylariales sp. PMI_506]|nr:hypothetical protein BX600DRAFT_497900 [Xylariales sp. PMI_506]
MSVTTVDNPITTTLSMTLADYEIHHTHAEDLPSRHRWVPLTDHGPPPVDNPPNWYDGHRGVPNHRPVNTQLDRTKRPWGSNGVESGFVFLMLNGVWLTGVANWLWRSTGGRINKTWWRWKVGGEF